MTAERAPLDETGPHDLESAEHGRRPAATQARNRSLLDRILHR
ncbi:MAG TPA: hypothetical protein VF971_08095 [Candidatus Limnocylindrales bacterium]